MISFLENKCRTRFETQKTRPKVRWGAASKKFLVRLKTRALFRNYHARVSFFPFNVKRINHLGAEQSLPEDRIKSKILGSIHKSGRFVSGVQTATSRVGRQSALSGQLISVRNYADTDLADCLRRISFVATRSKFQPVGTERGSL